MDVDFSELMTDWVYIRPKAGRSAWGTVSDGPDRGPFRVRWESEPRMSRTTPGEEEYGTHFVVFDGDPSLSTEDSIVLPDGRVERVVRVERLHLGVEIDHTEVWLAGTPGPSS